VAITHPQAAATTALTITKTDPTAGNTGLLTVTVADTTAGGATALTTTVADTTVGALPALTITVDDTDVGTITALSVTKVNTTVGKAEVKASKSVNKTIITPEHLKTGYSLSSGKNGRVRGLYDGISFSCYEQDLLVKKGALTVQNEQILTSRNPVVQALAERGSIAPAKKYEYGVYKENMWISQYKNSIATSINTPVINEIDTVIHPDSIGLNTSHCESSDKLQKVGVLVFQHANVLYENHNGINFSVPSDLRLLSDAIDPNKIGDWKDKEEAELVFCMVAVPENNNSNTGKTGVNPGNSALLNIVARDFDISNCNSNQWGMCYEEIVVEKTVNNEIESEFLNEIYQKNRNFGETKKVMRDIQFNMIIDLFRSRNTTIVTPVIAFNKLPRIEQVKTALMKNVLGYKDANGTTVAAIEKKGVAPFLDTDFDYGSNFIVISRFKYHTDDQSNALNATTVEIRIQKWRNTLFLYSSNSCTICIFIS
jgi:hypothetical protein